MKIQTLKRGAVAAALVMIAAACGGSDAPAPAAPAPAPAPAPAETPAAPSTPVTLTYAHYLPEGLATTPDNEFARRVSEYSNGSITIDFSWGAALGGAAELPFLVEGGAVDMAPVVPAFNADAFPNVIATQLIWWSSGDYEVDLRRQNDLINEMHVLDLFVSEWAGYNQRPVFVQMLPPYFFYSNDANCSVAGLSGQRIRSLGRDLPRAFEVRNITPLNMTTPEMYEGLDRGTVERVTLPPDVYIDGRFYEISNQACGPIFWLGAGHTVTINNDTWASLDDAQRAAMLRAAQEVQEFSLEFYLANQTKALQAHTDNNVTFKVLPAAEKAAWIADAPDFPAEWLQRRLAAGEGAAAQEVYDKIMEIAARNY
jgi:TRAP-type C4-dicarboxylate transport system substrate-binding protein